MIRKVVIANRGEIACRIIRTCRELGIDTVALYSDADRHALHVALADQAVRLGPGEAGQSYLNQERVLEAAVASGADALHPGYGFFSENASFVEALEKTDLTFIGPKSSVIASMGDKLEAKRLAARAQVPLVPGIEVNDDGAEALEAAVRAFGDTHGYPLLLKAASGGGGRGIRKVYSPDKAKELAESASREAKAFFGDGRMFVEQLIEEGRHIEVQLLGDNHGTVRALGLRDCSMQRNHQKVIEEAPASGLSESLQHDILNAARRLGEVASYSGAGTVEFLVDKNENFYFLEVNSRLQVEHPVTELVTGLDLVAMQIHVANGARLEEMLPEELPPLGHAIEVRLCAEAPESGFQASTGSLTAFEVPTVTDHQSRLRCDMGVKAGDTVSHYYDSMIGKVIVHSATREQARIALVRALGEIVVGGVYTNSWYLHELLQSEEFITGTHHIHSADRLTEELTEANLHSRYTHASACVAIQQLLASQSPKEHHPWTATGWELGGPHLISIAFTVREASCPLLISRLTRSTFLVQAEAFETEYEVIDCTPDSLTLAWDGALETVRMHQDSATHWVATWHGCFPVQRLYPTLKEKSAAASTGETAVVSPLPGTIVRIEVAEGDTVEENTPLCTLESMKMEHQIKALRAGTVERISVASGDSVSQGQVLVEFSA